MRKCFLISFILLSLTSQIFPQELLWEKKFNSADLYYQNIAIDSAGKIYVLTLEGIILFSSDFGENWDQIYLPFIDAYNRDIAVDKYNHIYLTRASSNSPGIFKSTDSGSTWFSLNFGIDRSASKLFIDTNGDIYAGSWEGIFRSTDYGESWDLFYFHSNVTTFIDKQDSIVLIGSSKQVHYSTNNGQIWLSNGFVVGNYWPSVFCGAINDEYFYAGTDTGLFISTNFGTTWNRKLPSSDFRKIASNYEGNIFIATTNGNYFSNDAGFNIRELNEGLLSSYSQFIQTDHSGRIYTGLKYDGIYKGNKSVNNLLANFNPRNLIVPLVPGYLDSIKIENAGFEQLEISEVVSFNPLIDVTPTSANLSPGQSIFFRFYFNAFPKGVYSGPVNFISNSFSSPDILDMTINFGVPYLFKSPEIIDFGVVFLLETEVDTVLVKNLGFDTLEVDSITITDDDVTVDLSNFILQHNEQIEVQVEYTPQVLNHSNGWLILYSNSPTSPDSVLLLLDMVTSVSDHFTNYANYLLEQNYPNPFNPSTTISYEIPERSFVTIKIYNVLGNEIVTLVNEEKLKGSYEIEFNGTGLPSGIYFYRLHAGNFVRTKKMVLLK